MNNEKQKRLATVLSICIFTAILGIILYESEGIFYHWVDESPGPDYVRHNRTPLESAGVLIIWLMVGSGLAVGVYYMIRPS